MKAVFLLLPVGTLLTACHPSDPYRSGLYAVSRDIVETDTARLAGCVRALVEPRLRGAQAAGLRERAAADGSWFLIGRRDGETAQWEIRLTRIGTARTEIEIDAAPAAFGTERADAGLAALVAICAAKGPANRRRR